jgi:MoaA/NifB/PqqE/SkfB family radical SAM enzyme
MTTENVRYGFASEKHRIFPPMVVVSIVNICNLKCIHCYYSKFIKHDGYKPNMMAWEIWTKMCDEMAEHPWSILNLGTDGEPLMHKKFLDMMRYAKRRGIYPINLTTNGILLEGALAEQVVKERLIDVVNISLDAFSEEKYRLIRGGRIKRVYDNVNNIIDLRDRHNSDIKIQVNIIDQPEVKDEVDDFVRYWTPRADNVMVRTYYDATTVLGGTGPNITGKQAEFEEVERWPCQQFWRRFNIYDDGIARFCVDDWFNKTKVGDLNTQSIAEIWTGEEYEKLRHLQITGQFESIPYCSKCTEWQGMKWDYDYFTAMEKMLGKELL